MDKGHCIQILRTPVSIAVLYNDARGNAAVCTVCICNHYYNDIVKPM